MPDLTLVTLNFPLATMPRCSIRILCLDPLCHGCLRRAFMRQVYVGAQATQSCCTRLANFYGFAAHCDLCQRRCRLPTITRRSTAARCGCACRATPPWRPTSGAATRCWEPTSAPSCPSGRRCEGRDLPTTPCSLVLTLAYQSVVCGMASCSPYRESHQPGTSARKTGCEHDVSCFPALPRYPYQISALRRRIARRIHSKADLPVARG